MTDGGPGAPGPATGSTAVRALAIGASALRYALPIVALPLAPALVPDRIPLLLLLRPGKEILLLGGGLSATSGVPAVWWMLAAYVPLMVGGVWAFFLLGRCYADDLRRGEGPRWLARLVPPDRLRRAQRVLNRRGPLIAVLGRVAAFPPTVIAAAAGTSRVDTARFLAADLVGALLSFGIVVAVGMALGDAYERGGPWLAAGGVAAFLLLVALLTRWMAATEPADEPD